ncbi:PQ loop repeat containing 3 [Nesidiocoris tenuis]|uniref:PQ loop repeat containing 3 n=1 Tax=Nesidiocoris tenuis TaxID=355587 RepID=A0ABN7BA09_9HEMI|nr:PQ loop repeat containing 3 [Nesidiocoris tenuis]
MDIAHLISDLLSIITISMCLFLKVPQIMNIVRRKSADGMNIYSLLMELASYSTTALYNYTNGYAILTYLEYPIIIAQEYVLIYLVLYHQDLVGQKSILGSIAYALVVTGFLSRWIPPSVLTLLIPFCTPVSLSSKALQLWEILRKMNADTVSVSTWIISALTNASRIYTIYMDSMDMLLLANVFLSTFMSGSIALVAYILQNKNKTKSA